MSSLIKMWLKSVDGALDYLLRGRTENIMLMLRAEQVIAETKAKRCPTF